MSMPKTTEKSLSRSGGRASLCYRFVDLVGSDEYRGLWRPGRSSRPSTPPTPSGLASPMAFWMAEGDAPRDAGDPPFRLWVVPLEASEPSEEILARSPFGRGRPVQTIRVKGPIPNGADLSLTIGPGGARAATDLATWEQVSEPVLLAVSQYARFLAVDDSIDRLTERARGDLDHATMPGVSSLRNSSRLTADAREARALLLDLPYFQSPLSDPYAFTTSAKSASVYENIAEKLHFEEWSESIDDRSEAVEDAYEATTEKLFEYKNFAWEALLEAVIVVILLIELAITTYDVFIAE